MTFLDSRLPIKSSCTFTPYWKAITQRSRHFSVVEDAAPPKASLQQIRMKRPWGEQFLSWEMQGQPSSKGVCFRHRDHPRPFLKWTKQAYGLRMVNFMRHTLVETQMSEHSEVPLSQRTSQLQHLFEAQTFRLSTGWWRWHLKKNLGFETSRATKPQTTPTYGSHTKNSFSSPNQKERYHSDTFNKSSTLPQGKAMRCFLLNRNGFMVCGDIVRIRLPRGSDGLPKGTAFIQFSNEEEVQRPEQCGGLEGSCFR